MAQWRRLLNLDPTLRGRVNRLYLDHKVPRDIRSCFCDWVEEQDWDAAAADEATAKTIFQTLLLKLDERIKESLYDTLEGPDFSVLKDHLMNLFEHCPMELAEKLSLCLQEEQKILDSRVVDQRCSTTTSELTQTDLENKIAELKNRIKKIEEEIKAQEKVEVMFKTWENQVKQMNGMACPQLQQLCLDQGNAIRAKRQELVREVSSSVVVAHQVVQTLVRVELPEWKRRQQMSCIGNPVKTSLDQLEKWFSAVGEMLLEILQQLTKLQKNHTEDISELLQQTCTCFTDLLNNALVVEEQPVTSSQPHRPLVLRTTVGFTGKLRFLANLPIFSKEGFKIKAEFDKDVEEVNTIKGFRQFLFKSKDTAKMKTDKENGSIVAELNLEITEDKSKRKRSNMTPIRVTEELHIIKFSTDLEVSGLRCQVQTSSLPLVVVSTTTQIPSAWAAIMWYNLLSVTQPTSLSVFVNPPPLSWESLSQALSWQFISAGDRELSQDQLSALKLKVTDDPNELVSWTKFSNLKKGPWIWIDGILDLIENHLKDHWRDGSIVGFVSKDKAAHLLQNKQSGNFLLRFSEKNREGAVSFSLVKNSKKRETRVGHMLPFTKEELSRMSLADHINQYREKGRSSNPLLYLYPDIPKDQAFGRYYSKTETTESVAPYLRRKYVCEGDYPTPPSSSPELSQSDLNQDLMDFVTSELLQSGPYDASNLFPEIHLYDTDNNDMDVSENC